MKKLLAAATAAALMFASTGVALGAFVWNNQGAFQTTNGMAISNSGHNYAGGMVSFQGTGQSYSFSQSLSEANHLTVIEPFSVVGNNQGAFQTTNGMAISNSGHNYAGGMFTGQTTGQSYSYSVVGSGANWATIADHCSDCINPNLPVAK